MSDSKKKVGTWTLAVNWGIVQDQIESVIGIIPDQESIEEALELIEKEFPEEELYSKDAEELEELIENRLLKILRKKRGKEIKKQASLREKEQKIKTMGGDADVKIGIQLFDPTTGSMKDLSDMDIDPEMFEQISKGVMDQMFGQQKAKKPRKPKSDDDDEEEDAGSSFYL